MTTRTTNHDFKRITHVSINAARFAIDTLDQLMRYRSTSSSYADIVDNRIDDVWLRLITIKNLVMSAERNFLLMLEKYAQLSSGVSLFQAMVRALETKHYDFFTKAIPLSGIPTEVLVILCCRFGALPMLEHFLAKDPSLINTAYDSHGAHNIGNREFHRIMNATTRNGYLPLLGENDERSDAEDEEEENDDDSEAERENDDDSEAEREYDADINADIMNDYKLFNETNLIMIACTSGNIELVQRLEALGLSIQEDALDDDDLIDCFDMAAVSGNKKLMRYVFLELNRKGRFLCKLPEISMNHVNRDIADYCLRLVLRIGEMQGEIDEFDAEDFIMFRELQGFMPAVEFLELIHLFGNTNYYGLATEVFLEKHEQVVQNGVRFLTYLKLATITKSKVQAWRRFDGRKPFLNMMKLVEKLYPTAYKEWK